MGKNSLSFWMMQKELFRLSCALVLLITTGLANPTDQHNYMNCLTKPYNPNEQICCGGQLYNKITENGTEIECCTRQGFGSEVYTKGEKICCGVQLTSAFNRDNPPVCCNGQFITDKEYDCCGGRDYGEIYKYSPSSICCTISNEKKSRVHNGLTSDDDSQRHGCCGIEHYDKNTQDCEELQDREFKVTKRHEKCGPEETRYDPSDQICCDETGLLIDIPPTETQKSSITKPPDWACFNNKLYDRNIYYVYRANRLVPNDMTLCGNDLFSEKDRTKLCCDNILHSLAPGYNISCCGKQLRNLNDSTVQCCNNTIIPISDGCCDNKPYQKDGLIDCCARTLYNKTSSICCTVTSNFKEVVIKEAANHTDCCLGRTYNIYDNKKCHEGNIISNNAVSTTELSQVTTKPTVSLKLAPEKTYLVCPFCPPRIETNSCNKKNVYALAIYRIKRLESGTLMNGVILSPLGSKGVFVEVQTNHICSCFKHKKNFHLITNRSLRVGTKLKNPRTAFVRFTQKDIFIESDAYSLEKCLKQQHDFQYAKKKLVKNSV